MSKWRPSNHNIYVIPDIHGQLDSLTLILDRILPLKKKDPKDKIIFLGDYIDRGFKSPELLDLLIDLKEKYKDQVIFLRGNHEQMLLNALKPHHNSDKYLFWMRNGGENTLFSYLEKAKANIDNPYILPRNRIADYIPKNHLDFLNSLDYYYELDNFFFVHGGMDPTEHPSLQAGEVLMWDRSLYIYMASNPGYEAPWEKCIVTGHNSEFEDPLILNKFIMLDSSSCGRLNVLELNSRTGFYAKPGKKRLIKMAI